jgi:hypothetical protein
MWIPAALSGRDAAGQLVRTVDMKAVGGSQFLIFAFCSP